MTLVLSIDLRASMTLVLSIDFTKRKCRWCPILQ